MPLKIVRNDIIKMNTEIIVNTANDQPRVGTGCDYAIYQAAGFDELLAYRKEHIGFVPEGEVFLTPAFNLPMRYIIHAVSPLYRDGLHGEKDRLRSCYRKSLYLALELKAKSIAFPLISTGGFGYPKEEGLRIALDEINAFLLCHDMLIYLVVFGENTSRLSSKLYPDLESYIDQRYVEERRQVEYSVDIESVPLYGQDIPEARMLRAQERRTFRERIFSRQTKEAKAVELPEEESLDFEVVHESKLEERMQHLSDTFSEYLMYLIQSRNMENADVYKRAVVDKKIFSKIKNNVHYHPKKMTALCLCIGAKLNLDQSKDLLARAGYALSPCDKTDIIFSYFIENEIYDMIELDIQLEEHGLPCIIS